MIKSHIFYTDIHKAIEASIVRVLNAQPDYLSTVTVSSPRAVGDAIQTILSENFEEMLGNVVKSYSDKFARRAMADLAFYDHNDFYYVVDVKTHCLGTSFNMPNLVSVERLARFYEDDQNCFSLLMVKYEVESPRIVVKEAHFVPIEFLSWECLTIGALGWGQIQIANANVIKIKEKYPRKQWMLELCDTMLQFYPKEIGKIGKRVSYFERVKREWEAKQDIPVGETTVELITPSAPPIVIEKP